MSRFVNGIYDSREAAERGVDALLQAGFPRDEIGMIVSGTHRDRHFGAQDAPSQAGTGAAAGGALGAVLGGLVAIASLAVPGGIFVAGPIAAAIGGGVAGAAGGGLLGALIGAGIPEREADVYEKELERGGILLSVAASKQSVAHARDALQRTGARHIGPDPGIPYDRAHAP